MMTIQRRFFAGFPASFLAGAAAAREKAPKVLRVGGARIQFHLMPNPVLEFAVSISGQRLEEAALALTFGSATR
jgi:hypothetical protein